MEWVWIVVMAVAFGLLAWWAYSTDPHWVAKDGRAFTCKYQYLGANLVPQGRWRDGRAFIDGSRLIVRPRGFFQSAKRSAHFEVVRKAEPTKTLAVYLVDGGGVGGHDFAALRIPLKSRAIPEMDKLLTVQS